jgi:hypothetical protein
MMTVPEDLEVFTYTKRMISSAYLRDRWFGRCMAEQLAAQLVCGHPVKCSSGREPGRLVLVVTHQP